MHVFLLLTAPEGEEHDIYWKTEQACVKHVKQMLFYIFSQQLYYVLGLVLPLYCIYHGNSDTSAWPLVLNIFFPLDIAVLWHWFLKWCITFNMAFTYCLSTTSVTSYFVCCCFYAEAICEQFVYKMNLVKNYVTLHSGEKNVSKRREILQAIKDNLSASVDLHAEVFRWVLNSFEFKHLTDLK